VFDVTLLAPSAKSSIQLRVEGGAVLRPLQEQDVSDGYVIGLNDPRVAQNLVGPRKQKQTLESVRAYVGLNWRDDRSVLFGVNIDGALRGTVRLYHIDDTGNATMGIALFDTRYWGLGWGSRCIRAVAEYGIRELGLRRIMAGSYERNIAGIRSFAKAGFKRTPDRDFADGYDRWITCAFTDAA
jgi:RimJ/RimL family protein N-acetyltransferase